MTDLSPTDDTPVVVALPAELVARLAAAVAVVAPAEAGPEPYVRQGNEFEPGTRVRLKGETAVTVSDDRWVLDDNGRVVTDSRHRPIRRTDERGQPLGEKVVKGDHSPHAPREGVVVRHEPSHWTKAERRHVILLPTGGEISADHEDLEAVEEG